jgi:SpoVK/Ycf46/Vps4 family AAA+-type ATPase
MNLFCCEKFIKSIPREKKEYIERFLLKFKEELDNTDQGIFGTSRGSQTKEFQGTDNLFEFRVSDGERIIFTYNNMLANLRDGEESGIFLIEYVSHDDQNRRAKEYAGEELANFEKVLNKIDFEPNRIEEFNVKDEEIDVYSQYFDLEKTVSYMIEYPHEGETIYEAARINAEQFKYVQDLQPLLLTGGAGSGKTLVAIHKANAYRRYEGQVAYFALSKYLSK